MTTRTESFDVVVVGARCAGAATALLLARSGHRVALVDRALHLGDTVSTHGMARGAVVQLSRWGLLDAVLASGAPAVRQVTFRVGDDELVRPLKARAGVDVLVAPRRYILDPLLAQAAQDAGAELRLGTNVTDVVREASGRVVGVTATDSAGSLQLAADFVVGADGVRSAMAGRLDARVLVTEPRDSSTFYAYFSDIDAIGYEFHVGSGAMAGIFPTHDGEACVWLCSPASTAGAVRSAGAARAEALSEAIAAVSPALGRRLRGGRVRSGVRGVVGLPNHVREAVGRGWALVGDAGYHRDPVTGHGMTDAFRDAELLACALDDALAGRVPAEDALTAYQTRRDDALRDVFALTCEIATYPAADRFVQLQKELSAALEAEAEQLAALPPLRHRTPALVA